MRISKNNLLISFVTIGLYLGITDFFGLISFDKIFSYGQLYDVFFVLALLIWSLQRCKNRGLILRFNKKNQGYFMTPFIIFVVYVIISGIVLIETDKQSVIKTIYVLREVLYLFIFLYYRDSNYDVNKVLQLFVSLEVIGSLVYFVVIFKGPFTPIKVNGL